MDILSKIAQKAREEQVPHDYHHIKVRLIQAMWFSFDPLYVELLFQLLEESPGFYHLPEQLWDFDPPRVHQILIQTYMCRFKANPKCMHSPVSTIRKALKEHAPQYSDDFEKLIKKTLGKEAPQW
ncbi:MAG: hypothetical protein HC880_21060 [Bacteroidia bacterium]|nr:hypothetical protein [Bacteroidia bacterium]